MKTRIEGVWHKNKAETMKLKVFSNNTVEIQLTNMGKYEQDEILAGIRKLYGTIRIIPTKEGVKIYAPSNI